jgi:hypothetical protein
MKSQRLQEVFFVVPQNAVAVTRKHVIPPGAIPWRLRLSLRQRTARSCCSICSPGD